MGVGGSVAMTGCCHSLRTWKKNLDVVSTGRKMPTRFSLKMICCCFVCIEWWIGGSVSLCCCCCGNDEMTNLFVVGKNERDMGCHVPPRSWSS